MDLLHRLDNQPNPKASDRYSNKFGEKYVTHQHKRSVWQCKWNESRSVSVPIRGGLGSSVQPDTNSSEVRKQRCGSASVQVETRKKNWPRSAGYPGCSGGAGAEVSRCSCNPHANYFNMASLFPHSPSPKKSAQDPEATLHRAQQKETNTYA